MIMQARVISVQWNQLLVWDLRTRQQVLVNTRSVQRFRPGQVVRIRYNGVMTNSIPPQITAIWIFALPWRSEAWRKKRRSNEENKN